MIYDKADCAFVLLNYPTPDHKMHVITRVSNAHSHVASMNNILNRKNNNKKDNHHMTMALQYFYTFRTTICF